MSYCTRTDLETRAHPANIIRWADDDNDGLLNGAESAIVTAMIERADGIIDAKLGHRYSVPFDPVPQQVKGLSIDLAVYFLATRRGFAREFGGEEALWKSNFDYALGLLDALSKGELSLPNVETKTAVYSTNKDVPLDFSVTKKTAEEENGALDQFMGKT